jgi:hypothetical protein
MMMTLAWVGAGMGGYLAWKKSALGEVVWKSIPAGAETSIPTLSMWRAMQELQSISAIFPRRSTI